ncbi:hypothetical protein DID77_00030 [Candidatus Marinamargulisbacteria bacterium SCGC AG-439-L15]|nr:hypothetical protein DID77_00030 [Candidatus Marinamargulisbacteria bacterium SCGC AG-439-L15]
MAIEQRASEYIDMSSLDPFEQVQKIRRYQQQQHQHQQVRSKKGRAVTAVDDKKAGQEVSAKKLSGAQLKMTNRFVWDKDDMNDYCIKPKLKNQTLESLPIEKGGSKIVSFLGYKIDISSRVDNFKSLYQKYYVDGRSHNFLLAKYASLKFGMIQFVLSVLGIEMEELQKLQKKALQRAIDNNKALYIQNEYNSEMLKLFGTHLKKETSRRKILDEVRTQLVAQMALLGHEGYYTKDLQFDIKLDQLKKIVEELLQEKQNLTFMRDFC